MFQDSGEKLFLCKQHNPEIYVEDFECLTQDEIHGIRFLYAKFKLNTPGVILSKYEKRMHKVVVCFLQAVQIILNKPVLIMCNTHDCLENWKSLFHNLFYDDIVFESKNMFCKKKIFVNTLQDISLCSKQNWSIAIIDDNVFSKEIFRTELKANYKVWLTSVDLKRNLPNLSQLYSWFYPKKEKFDIQKFQASTDVGDKIKKTILLDTFLEDILITSSTSTVSTFEEPLVIKAKEQKRRKLKDITGKKIKHSKRQLNDEDLPNIAFDQVNNNKCENFLGVAEDNDSLAKLETNDQQVHNLNFNDDSIESQSMNFDSAISDLVETEKNVSTLEQDKRNQKQIFENNSLAMPDLPKDDLNQVNSNVSITEFNNEIVIESTMDKDIKINKNVPTTNKNDTLLHSDIDLQMPHSLTDKSHESKNEVSTEGDLEITINKNDELNVDFSTNKSNCLESKLKELEAKALKRFKGSLLDSIF